MTNPQKELVDACEQANQAWVARVKAEVDLWTQMGTKLLAARSAPEALQTYQQCLAKRMRMAMEDAQKASEDYQKLTQKMSRLLSGGGADESSP